MKGRQTFLRAWAMLMILQVSTLGGARADVCDSMMAQLLPCLPAVLGAHPFAPTSSCCTAVRSVDSRCVCSSAYGRLIQGLNTKVAAGLPKKCGRVVPKNYVCNGVPLDPS
ncbi:hypothetical protein O6H91_06G025000 [Diphasiastrum complanatum]|uniref:Uncharacterized protein n=1 Tax=Diphasiastrum complanatum TaxID=34168 RepID=A0ACC2DC31_DIPCM|nr:hypothetical protein O6H91_06G025000 [Diphasiastrum complanatum]